MLLCCCLFCLCSTLGPGQSTCVTLHFLALREGLLDVGDIFLYETKEQRYYAPEEVPTFFAVHRSNRDNSHGPQDLDKK